MNKPAPPTKSERILTVAVQKTEQIQADLTEAVDKLGSANAVLSGPLSADESQAALANAVEQNVAAEAKVQEANEELEAVKDLIETAKVAQSANANSGHGTASILAYFEGRRAQASEDELAALEKKNPQ